MHAPVRAIVVAALALWCGASAAQTQDNDALRDLITALGVTHNVAYAPALLPAPFGIVPGAVVYAVNLGLKHVPPVLEAPPTVYRYPNTGDGCAYHFNYPRQSEEDRQDYLGLITSFPTDWGDLGAPQVFHVNTDVRVSVLKPDGHPIGPGTVSLAVGANGLTWRGDTLITPILDYPPWMLLGAGGAEDNAKRSARAAFMLELLGNAAQEGLFVGADWFVLDAIPTPAPGYPDGGGLRNEQPQSFVVYDTVPPTLTTTLPSTTVEATRVGGEYLRDHIGALQNSITVHDACDRPVTLSYNGPPFLPLGQQTAITWTAQDPGPNTQGQRNQVQLTQTITVQDTLPPLLNAPSGEVVVSDQPTTTVALGEPAVFDLADVRVNIANDAPASFARDTRTQVTWTATDSSNNQTTKHQWITVKSPGTNTAPVAQAVNTNAISYAPLTITLTGVDNDLLSGRYDQLSFALSAQPANGFFVAPLFPYFIDDYRVENEFGLSPPELNQYLRDLCDAQSSAPMPHDFVYDPRYITIADDGSVLRERPLLQVPDPRPHEPSAPRPLRTGCRGRIAVRRPVRIEWGNARQPVHRPERVRLLHLAGERLDDRRHRPDDPRPSGAGCHSSDHEHGALSRDRRRPLLGRS